MFPNEENFYRIIDFVPIPLFVADAEDRYLFMNQAARDFLDYRDDDIEGKKVLDVFRIEDNPDKITGEDNFENYEERYELEFVRRDGEMVSGEVISRSLPEDRRLISIYDITERKRAEQSLLISEDRQWQAHKYDALGKLAGGVAHDFNNFLAVILLQTDMLNLQLSAESPHHHRVNEIKDVVNNAAEIVRKLLAFGRKQALHPVLVNLNQSVSVFSEKLPALIDDNIIETRFVLYPHLGSCLVDRKQINNILIELVRNAADAMPDGGVLEIETKNIILDSNSIRHKVQPPGAYVQISVTDIGSGMDEEVLEHLFEPFYSTKQTDKSAGLGLATVYGTVKQMKGFIWVKSIINQGTTFTIQFPNIEKTSA